MPRTKKNIESSEKELAINQTVNAPSTKKHDKTPETSTKPKKVDTSKTPIDIAKVTASKKNDVHKSQISTKPKSRNNPKGKSSNAGAIPMQIETDVETQVVHTTIEKTQPTQKKHRRSSSKKEQTTKNLLTESIAETIYVSQDDIVAIESLIETKKLSRSQVRRKKKAEKKKGLLKAQILEKIEVSGPQNSVETGANLNDKKVETSQKVVLEVILPYIVPQQKELTPKHKKNSLISKFLDTVESFLKNRIFVEKDYRIVLAVSGGVDSVVMMDCMAHLSEKIGFRIYVAHFNHTLRGKESDLDVDFVKNLSKQYNLQFITSSGNVKSYSQKNNLSIENAARILRYNFFERTSRNLEADLLATAHTSDDSVETFFINLLRGSGLTGLSGIPETRKFVKNVQIIRPLLNFSKNEIKKYAEFRKLEWREDETNILLNYTRNKVRLELIPKLKEEFNPSIEEAILRTAKLIYGADSVIHGLVKKYMTPVISDVTTDKISIKIPILQTHSEFMQGEIIQSLWMKYFRLQPLSLNAVDRILSLCEKQTGTQIEIGAGFIALRDRNLIIITRNSVFKQVKLFGTIPSEFRINGYKISFVKVDKKFVKITENPDVEYFDFDKLGTYVEIRNWEQGDLFHPLGAPGEMKVSDFLTNEKISMLDKPNVIIVRNAFDTVWVIGKRISEKFKIDGNTRSIIKAEIITLK